MESLTPNLMVNNVNDTVHYYEKLGFKLIMSVPETGDFDWAMMTNGDASVMFQSKASMASELELFGSMEPGGAFGMYVRMSGLAKHYEHIQKLEVELLKPWNTTFYGAHEFTIRDLQWLCHDLFRDGRSILRVTFAMLMVSTEKMRYYECTTNSSLRHISNNSGGLRIQLRR